MKKLLLKLNMAIILVVILFASTAYGAIDYSKATVDEIWNDLLVNNIKFGSGYYGAVRADAGLSNGGHHNNYVIIDIDKSNVPEGYVFFNNDSIMVKASDGSSNTYRFAVDYDNGYGTEQLGYDLNDKATQEIKSQYNGGTTIYTDREHRELYYIQIDDDFFNPTNAKISYTSDYGYTFTYVNTSSVEQTKPEDNYMNIPNGLGTGTYDVYFEVKYPNGEVERIEVTDVYQQGSGIRIDDNALDNDKQYQASYRNLFESQSYYVSVPQKVKDAIENGASVIIRTNRVGNGFNGSASSGGLAESQMQEEKGFFEKIEEILAGFIISIAKVVNWLIGKVVGRQITLDDIIFNKFSEIRLDFFKTDIFGNNVTSDSTLVMDLREPVTTMYNFFKNLALIGYLIILIYIGIKIMISSTVAKKKATYKETFMYWVTGIIILFFMPYYMKYVIALDEAIITYISDDSGIRSQASRSGQENASQFNSDANKGFLKTTFDDDEGDLSKSVIDFSGQDYMSAVGKLASEHKKLGYAIAFLVLTWQIVTMLVYYYKRIFITALLIMIFPLIAFTFVWDKLNDGKSQALSAWIREFTITVFVQIFHAIVYVFITNTIYATIQESASGVVVNADFILLIIASSFMFVGEDILKKMFGGGGESLGSATQSAAKIAIITKGTVGMGTRVIKNTVSKDGFVRKTASSIKEARKDLFLSGKPVGAAVKDLFTGSQSPSRMEMLANDQARHSGVGAYLPSEGEITPTISEAAEMLYDLNSSSTPEEFAGALDKYHKLMDARNGIGVRKMTDYERNQFDEMMKKSGINLAQLDRLDKAMEKAAADTASIRGNIFSAKNRDKMTTISQNLRIEIEAIFPATDREGNPLTGSNNLMANKVMNAALISMAENGILATKKPKNFEKEWNQKIEKAKNTAERIGYKENTTIDIAGSIQRRKTATQDIMIEYLRKNPSLSAEQEENARNIAKHIAGLQQAYNGDASKYQVAKAFEVIEQSEENKEIAKIMMEIAGVDTDIENLKYLLTKKISISAGARHGVEAKTLFNTSKNRLLDSYFTARRDEIYHQFRSTISGTMSEEEEREAQLFALHLARIENYDMGLVGTSDIRTSIDILGGNQELANRMMQAASIDGDYEKFRIEIDHLTDVEDWTNTTVNDMETKATSRSDEDPYITILDIIEAAKNGTMRGESKKIGSDRDLFKKATRDGANAAILERKREEYSRRERMRAQQLDDAAKDFGEFALEAEGYNETPADMPSAEVTLDGITRDEMRKLAKENLRGALSNTAKLATDVLVTPVTTVGGFAIGAAVTDDFMPAEEALLGAISGNKIASQATNTIETLSHEKDRNKKLEKIKKEINARVKSDETQRLEARQAFEDANDKARDGLDGSLVFTGANATIHQEADGTISATVNIRAQNAAFVHISEKGPIPSSGWQAYQESVYYQFEDNSPATHHTLYIYLKDRSGNIQGKKISGIHL